MTATITYIATCIGVTALVAAATLVLFLALCSVHDIGQAMLKRTEWYHRRLGALEYRTQANQFRERGHSAIAEALEFRADQLGGKTKDPWPTWHEYESALRRAKEARP